MKRIVTGISLIMLTLNLAHAQEGKSSKPLLDRSEISIGGGIARNSIDTPFGDFTETGVQFFAAYDLNRVNIMQGVNSSVELGYMDYGFARGDSGGLWVTGVIDGAIQNNFGWLARLGLDLGDDSGIMFGAGVSFGINRQMDLRGEYIIRDDIDSLQINLIFHL
ncbi:MAG: hypothetical protein OEY87_00290 [Gammaproteobacteria bacterium]|nr:hypothetical protein [Gammaproteobacteria bacterium]MDH5734531.1 hypothetical protein [Gammaproteobacteria bacterium]